MLKSVFVVVVLTVFSAACQTAAHELNHTINRGNAVVIELFYHDGTPFAEETYRVYRPGETAVFQTGKTDRLGRVVFVPDRDGSWRIQAFSEDGHGDDFTIDLENMRAVGNTNRGALFSWVRVVVGVCIILAVFGSIMFYSKLRGFAS